MHKLPKIQLNSKKSLGFTLVELLVVVSIITVLSSIAISIYSTIGARARDGRRRADIDEFRKAMELNYDERLTVYSAPVGTQFANGYVPQDPTVSSSYTFYNPTYNSGAPGPIPTTGTFTTFVICAHLEQAGGNSSDATGTASSGGNYYCQHNSR